MAALSSPPSLTISPPPSPSSSYLHYRNFLSSLPWERCATIPLPPCPSKPKHDSFTSFIHPYSHIFRRFYITAKRELSAAATHAAAVIAVVLVLFFLLGAESSFHTTPHSITLRSLSVKPQQSSAPNISPIQFHLHYHHSIPNRYLRMLTSGQHHQLLDLLSSSDNNTILSSPTRRAVFTQISDCHLEQCLRTIASAVAYAQITSRVAILFIHQLPNQPHLTQVLQLGPHGILNNHAILISLTSKISDFHNPTDPSVSDWADFSVVQALPPNSIPFKASTSNNPSVHDDLLSEDHTDGLPTIGNTKKVATLDNLAALDTHVSLSLSEVVWSRYAPRTAQEALLEHTFQASQTDYQVAISRASILGRHRDTRLIYTTDKKLHQVYHIPNMLLKGMSPLARKILFLKLQSKKRRGILHPKVLFVHTQYGLGNRLRALGSAMAFARRTDRVLVLIWEPDQHLNCKYTDLFVMNDEFVVSDAFSPGEEWPFRNNSAMDKMMMHVKWYNFMRVKGVKVISSNAAVEDDKKFHLYISTCYVIQSSVTPFIIRSTSSFWHVLRSLTPHIDVVRLVERFASYPVSNMIGIHIRGKMIKTDISGVNATNYTEESSRTTDYWRNLTRVDTFIEEMKRQTADQLFYVASDQKEVLQHLEREFPSRIFYTPRHCDSRNKDCLPFALADILLLSKCASLRGSYWSSFSELSTRIGGARFLLAGIDFGRP